MNGYARMERFSFEAYNEADDFFHIVERYRSRYGRYPAHIRTDHIYRNRKILAFCKEHGIRLTGPALGRPPKDKTLSREQKRQSIPISATATRWKARSAPSKRPMAWAALPRAWKIPPAA